MTPNPFAAVASAVIACSKTEPPHSVLPDSSGIETGTSDTETPPPERPEVTCPPADGPCADTTHCGDGDTYDEERLGGCCAVLGDIFITEIWGERADLENLNCLMSVEGTLHINGLDDTEIVVPRLVAVDGSVIVEYSQDASRVEFPSLTWVGEQLEVFDLAVRDLSGFQTVEYAGYGLFLSLEELESLDGVELAIRNLDDGVLRVQNYTELNDTSALQGLPEALAELTLWGSGQIDLSEPLPVRSIGDVVLNKVSFEDISFLSELEEITSSLVVADTSSLPSLSELTDVDMDHLDYIYIAGNAQMEDLRGLEGLTDVAYDATIQWSSSLRSLEGLDNLQRVGGTLEIDGNANLSDASLPSLEEVGGHFYWWGPDRLVDFTGLESFRTAGESVVIQTNAYSLSGLDGYEIARNFSVQFSDNLEDLTGLGGLTKARVGFVVWDCERLTSTRGLGLEDVGYLYLRSNPRLAVLDLPSLVSAREFIIEDNPQLPTCEIDRLVDQLAAVGSYPALTIGENGTDDPAACP